MTRNFTGRYNFQNIHWVFLDFFSGDSVSLTNFSVIHVICFLVGFFLCGVPLVVISALYVTSSGNTSQKIDEGYDNTSRREFYFSKYIVCNSQQDLLCYRPPYYLHNALVILPVLIRHVSIPTLRAAVEQIIAWRTDGIDSQGMVVHDWSIRSWHQPAFVEVRIQAGGMALCRWWRVPPTLEISASTMVAHVQIHFHQ